VHTQRVKQVTIPDEFVQIVAQVCEREFGSADDQLTPATGR
jgi:hypothetical protein